VAVIGGGASAVQFIGQIAPIADIVWVTRREPVWRDGFDGLEVVTGIEERAV
jgi:cation diffusion facilitator CzcD-associated flavoprotein CzcO